MKPLSYTQKKWAMATFLVGVLTVSTSLHQPALTSEVDLASTDDQVEGNLATSEGLVKVKYIKNGEEVIAVVPKTVEGKLCDACGKSYNLSVAFDKNKGDIDSLNVALLKQIAKSSKDKAPEATEADDRDEKADKAEKARAEKVKRDRKAFANAMKFCDSDEKIEKVECLVDGYMEVIKSKDSSDKNRISKELALEIFKKEIEPKMAAALTSTASYANFYEKKELQENMQRMLLTLDKIKSELPEAQNNVRSRVVSIERDVIKMRSIALKQTLEKAKANPNDHESHSQAMYEIEIMKYLNESMDSMNNPTAKVNRLAINGHMLESLKTAVANGKLSASDALQIYTKEYNNTVNAIMSGVTKSYRFQNGQTIVDPAAIILENAGLEQYSPRTNLPTGGAVTRSTLPAGVVNGQGQQFGTPALPGQQPQQGRTFQGRGF